MFYFISKKRKQPDDKSSISSDIDDSFEQSLQNSSMKIEKNLWFVFFYDEFSKDKFPEIYIFNSESEAINYISQQMNFIETESKKVKFFIIL